MPVPNEMQLMNVLCAFAEANPASTAADARDHLIATYPGTRPADAIAVCNIALPAVFVENGFDNDPDPANANWAKFRNRCAAVGATVGVEIAKALRSDLASRIEWQIFRLRLERADVIAARTPVVDERDQLLAHRDTEYPSGNPGTQPGSYIYSTLTQAIARLNELIQTLNAQRDAIDLQIANLGG